MSACSFKSFLFLLASIRMGKRGLAYGWVNVFFIVWITFLGGSGRAKMWLPYIWGDRAI